MDDDSKALERFHSDVPGLDDMLGGGMFVGGIYLVAGSPGLGKTIMANQIAYGHARTGRVLYVTLLAETHARLLTNLEQMAFFRRELVGASLHYLSAFQTLEKGKLDGLLGMLRKVVRNHKATLLVVDGLVTAGALAESPIAMKVFVHGLQVLVELSGCTCLLLTGSKGSGADGYAQRTMVDGIISMAVHRVGLQSMRELAVLKHRGSAHVTGASFYEISSNGIRIHPRIEAMLGMLRAPPERPRSGKALATGVRGMDAMMGGGLRPESTTMLLGSPGSGKTLLGLTFLAAGAPVGEPGLYVGFFEPPSSITEKMRSVGIDLAPATDTRGVEIQWHASQEQLADQLAEKLLERIAHRKVKRLFIDGLAGFRRALVYPERMGPFFTSLNIELRIRGVTTLVSEELTRLFGPGPEIPADTAAMVDNIIFLRYAEQGDKLQRLVSLIKMREGQHDSSIRELRITDRGLALAATRPPRPGASPRSSKKTHARSARRG
jgi:circadian clock protein KaiC